MATTAARIAASLLDTRLDVSLGHITPADYVASVREAAERGVTIPAEVTVFAARCETAIPVPVVTGHAFANPTKDVAEICECGAAFFDGYNLQAVKLAHLEHFAATATV